MAKIYLSPAAHAHDNRTQCPVSCGENVHCNLYMDKLEPRLIELGFEVKRGDKALTGSEAMQTRTQEANSWGADLYYVAHTNAGGGRYSMTMYYPGTKGQQWANILHSNRKCITHKLRSNTQLYEMVETKMPCLYDELFFHDNAEDCNWFHVGGIDAMVEETCKAFCEMFGIAYHEHIEPQPEPQPEPAAQIKAGDLVKIAPGAVYMTGKTIPSWVIAKNWYVDSVIGSRAVLGKSEDGKNNIKSPVDVKYLSLVEEVVPEPTPEPAPTPEPEPVVEVAPVVTYQAHIGTWFGRWLPAVVGESDYAGIPNKPITAIKAAVNRGVLSVRVHTVNGSWYAWVENNDKKQGGYAGVYGRNIDCVQMCLEGADGYDVEYRVAPVGKDYYPWVRSYNHSNSNGYAGSYGKAIDRLQIRIVKK